MEQLMESGINKNNSNVLLLITACVNPEGMSYTFVQNSKVRLKEYQEAIDYYLKETDYPILLIDNSMFDFSKYLMNYINDGRVEVLAFNGNNYDKKLGKGYGEGLIVNHAFKHSKFINKYKYIVKLTGRHQVINIKDIITSVLNLRFSKRHFVSTSINRKLGNASSDMIIASKEFYIRFFLAKTSQINDSQYVYFEHVLYNSIKESLLNGFQFIHFPLMLRQIGVSGSTGEQLYFKVTMICKIKTILKYIMYLLFPKILFNTK